MAITYGQLSKKIAEYLTQKHNEDYTKALNSKTPDYKEALENCRSAIQYFITHSKEIPHNFNNNATIDQLYNDILLWGPVTPLILNGTNEGISEIRIYGPYDITIQQHGLWKRLPIAFRSEHDLELMVNKITAYSDIRMSDMNGFTDRAKLPTGARVTIFQAPNTGPSYYLSIRIYDKKLFSTDNLVASDSVSIRQDGLVKFLWRSKANPAWMGPMTSGKTINMGAYAAHLPKQWHILTIEDSPELNLHLRNPELIVSELYVHEGQFALTWEKAGRMNLRTAATVIIWGELRDAASTYRAIDNMLTGHDGSSINSHAGSPREGLDHLANRYHEAVPSIDYDTALRLVCDAVDFIPMMQFTRTGKRYMGDISAVAWDHERKEPLVVPMLKRWMDKDDQPHEEYLGIPDFLKKKLLGTNAVFEEDFIPWETT